MTPPPKKRGLKIAGIVLLILLAIGGGIYLYITQHYKSIIRKKLPVIAARATDSLYTITADGFSINLFHKSFSIHGLHIRPDSAVLRRRRLEGHGPENLLDITIKEVEISGLKWKEMSHSKEISFGSIDIYHPKILITKADEPGTKDTTRVRKPQLSRIVASRINIIDPDIRYVAGEAPGAAVLSAKGGRIAIAGWELSPETRHDTTRFFFADATNIRLEQVVYHKPGGLYQFGMDTLHFISLANRMELAGVYVKPVVSKEAFYRVTGKQKEIFEGLFPHIRINDLNWRALLKRRTIEMESIVLREPDLEVFVSRLYPPNHHSRMGNYPHQLLQKLPVKIRVPEISIEDGRFRYKEENDKTQKVGTLDFSQIDGRITRITNIPEDMSANPHCTISLAGKFMHKSDIKATFDFPLTTRNGQFSVQGRLGELEASQVSETAKALAMAAVKTLKLHELTFDIKGNDTVSDGRITIVYNDLKVKLQKVEQMTQEMHSRGFLSLIANELILYNDNPMEGEALRVAITHVPRDSTKSFFNLIWRNMFEAGLQTAIRQEGAVDLMQKRKARKGMEKVHFFRKLFPKRKKQEARRDNPDSSAQSSAMR